MRENMVIRRLALSQPASNGFPLTRRGYPPGLLPPPSHRHRDQRSLSSSTISSYHRNPPYIYSPQHCTWYHRHSIKHLSEGTFSPSATIWRRRRTTSTSLCVNPTPQQSQSPSHPRVPRLRTKSTRVGADRRLQSRQRFSEALEEYQSALQGRADAAPTDSTTLSKAQWAISLRRLYESDAERFRSSEAQSDEADDDAEREDQYSDEQSTLASARAFTPPVSTAGQTASAAASAIRSVAGAASVQVADLLSSRDSNTWTFAHQRLRFPTDQDWPPPLPGIPGDDFADHHNDSTEATNDFSPANPADSSSKQLAALYPSPRTTCAPNLPPAPAPSARDLAALALDVHRFAARPVPHVVRKESYKSPAIPMSRYLRRQLREAEGSNDRLHTVWRCGSYSDEVHVSGLEDGSLQEHHHAFWLTERNNRLEFLGDALAKEIACRVVYHAFPDLNSGGISTAASHLTTNDTFGFLYDLSGLDHMRARLAGELLQEAVEKEKARQLLQQTSLEVKNGVDSEILDVDVVDLDQAGKADRFESYLAYIRLTHGPLVAEYWFSSLLRPWVDRIASDPGLYTMRNVSTAGHARRRVEERLLAAAEAERKRAAQEAELSRYKNSRWGGLAIAGKGLLRRLLGREERGRKADRRDDAGSN